MHDLIIGICFLFSFIGRGDFGNAFGNRDYDRGFGFNNGFGMH